MRVCKFKSIYPICAAFVFSLIGCDDDAVNSPGNPAVPTVIESRFGGGGFETGSDLEGVVGGGFLIGGTTDSYGSGPNSRYLIRLDTAGNEVWNKVYGDPADDGIAATLTTGAGNLLLVGSTTSAGAGMSDLSVLEVSGDGTLQWQREYGGADMDYGTSIAANASGGHLICGHSRSFSNGEEDFYAVFVDDTGKVVWQNNYGGTDHDLLFAVHRVNAGYLLVGSTRPVGSVDSDILLVRIDDSGTKMWEKTIGGTGIDEAHSVTAALDGGFVLLGTTTSLGAGAQDVYMVKTDDTGKVLWQKTFGGTESDGGSSIAPTTDGYFIGGFTNSFSTSSDAYVIRTDLSGTVVWQTHFGGTGLDEITAVLPIMGDAVAVTGVSADDLYFARVYPPSN